MYIHYFFSFLFFLGLTINFSGQRIDDNVLHDKLNSSCNKNYKALIFNNSTYDVKHYHIDVEIGIDQQYINGSVFVLAVANENISNLTLDLDEAFVVNSITGAASFSFIENELTVNLLNEILENEEFTLEIFYEGPPPLAGGYKGLRYETHNGNEPVIATLSTPYLAHTWWPCNDGTLDKADSVFVDITIKDTLVSGIPLMAVSNGILDEVVSLPNNKIQYQWKHRYPIVPYYVMVAISNYQIIEQTYNNGTENFPLKYYVFDNSISSATEGVEELPDVMSFFTTIFGPYPFADEKYSMTELGFYGGIENQTNSIINNMGVNNFGTVVHELAHMWFADMITCSDWHHGWVNEGFATYATALYYEESGGVDSYHEYMQGREFYNGGSVYMSDVSNPFTVFQSIIYNKGSYVLHMLRHVMGDEQFFESIYTYSTNPEFKYKHATTEDFQAVCEQVSGTDLSYFFDQWVYDEYYPKYEYAFYQDELYNTQLAIHQTQENDGWRPVFNMPIDVRFDFSDNTDTLIIIENTEVIQWYDFSFNKEVISVTIDPDKWILKATSEGSFNLSINSSNHKESAIILYPNPTNNDLNIVTFNSGLNLSTLVVYNISGKVVDRVTMDKFIGEHYIYSTSTLESGIYYLELRFQNNTIKKKFVVE